MSWLLPACPPCPVQPRFLLRCLPQESVGWCRPDHLSSALPRHSGPPRLAPGPRSVSRSRCRANPVPSPRAHPCACMIPALIPWVTAGCRASARSGECTQGRGLGCPVASMAPEPGLLPPAPAPQRASSAKTWKNVQVWPSPLSPLHPPHCLPTCPVCHLLCVPCARKGPAQPSPAPASTSTLPASPMSSHSVWSLDAMDPLVQLSRLLWRCRPSPQSILHSPYPRSSRSTLQWP